MKATVWGTRVGREVDKGQVTVWGTRMGREVDKGQVPFTHPRYRLIV